MAEPHNPEPIDQKGSGFKKKQEAAHNKKPTAKKNQIKSTQKSAIPKNVANRMARRVALTTGLPTISGMGVFIASYLLVSKGIFDIPPFITLLTSAAFFLTGLVGLSYGILSASWESSPGTFLGLENIQPNIRRVKDAFKTDNSKEE